jgi:acetyl esterase/lipase
MFSAHPEIGEGDRALLLSRMSQIAGLAGEDGRQALKVVREHTAEWCLDPDRIGILGFSAGGMVASHAALLPASQERPSFAAIIHGAPFEDVVVPSDVPPAFIAVCDDDTMAAGPCLRTCQAWQAAGRPVELHLYSKGGHGFGMRRRGLPADGWIDRFGEWLGAHGFVEPTEHPTA